MVMQKIEELRNTKFAKSGTLQPEEIREIVDFLDANAADISTEDGKDNFMVSFTTVYTILVNLRKNYGKETLNFLEATFSPDKLFESNTVKSAVALFFLRKTGRLGRHVTKNLLCMFLSGDKSIDASQPVWKYLSGTTATSEIKNYHCSWDPQGHEYSRLILAMIQMADYTHDKQLVLLANEINSTKYFDIIKHIKERNYDFIVFSPLVDRYIKYYVAEVQKADELQYLQKSYQLNPVDSITTLLEKISATNLKPTQPQKRKREVVDDEQIPYFSPEREYQVYMDQLNVQNIKYENINIGNKPYTVMTYNGCLFDVFNPEYSTLAWDERLSAVPYHRVKIVLKKMTGEELKAYKPTRNEVAYISCLGPNGLAITQTVVFKAPKVAKKMKPTETNNTEDNSV